MKVSFVVGGLPFGGIENLLFDVSRELLRRNFPFKVVNLSGSGDKLKEFLDAGIPVVNLGSGLKSIKTYRIDSALKLKEFFSRERPSVVHSMQFTGDYFSRLALLGDRTVKVITHVHAVRRERRFERKLFNRLLSFRTDLFLSVSRAVYEVVEKEHNLFKRRHFILYNGVDFSKFESQGSSELLKEFEGKRVFLFVGRLVKLKGVDLAIKAFSLIAPKFKDASLFIVGKGKEEGRLRSFVNSLNLNGRVKFLGYFPPEKLGTLYSSSFALLIPSETEGLSITHFEGAYFGLPAVVSPETPSLEVLSEGSLVAPRKEEVWAKRMELLLTDGRLYKELSERASKTARKYSISSYVDKLLALYQGLVKGELPQGVRLN
ncbi:glycosyltransferase [Thermovibrio sp.]